MTEAKPQRLKIVEARNIFGEVIARARYGNQPTILTNRNKEVAVIVSKEFYEQALADRARIEGLEK